LRCDVLLQVTSADVDPESKHQLSDVWEAAHNILQERELAVPPLQVYDPSVILSFYVYPKGQAHAMIGFYHDEMARQCLRLKESTDVVLDQVSKAAKAYLTAADISFEDDEHHIYALYKCGTPIKELLPVMKRIRLAIPKMKKIWENSALARGRDQALQQKLWTEEDLENGLEGRFTMEDKVMPESM